MTQEELARRAGVSPTSVVRMERGEIREPRLGTLNKVAGALGVEPGELLRFVVRAPVERSGAGAFSAVYQKDGEWWLGYVEELPGANSQERTLEECRESLREAVTLVLEANRDLTRTEFEDREVIREPLEA